MTDTATVTKTAQALVLAVFEHLGTQARALSRRPTDWIELLPFGGQSVLSLSQYTELEAALRQTFPNRFEGSPGDVDFTSQYAFSLLDGAVLRAVLGREEFVLRPDDLAAAIDEMLDLLQRDRDRAIAARVVTDVAVDAPLYAGVVELRPIGSWGLIEAYRDINGFIPGAGPMLDAEGRYRIAGSFTFAVMRTETDAPVGARPSNGYSLASRHALARLETTMAALRLATATTSQAVADVTSAPGHVRLYRPEIFRHEIGGLEQIQRISHVRPDLAGPIAALGDHLATWTGGDGQPHSLGVALGRYGRSFQSRPWFDMLVDVIVGLEAALLGGSEQEEIGLRLRSRAAALLATAADPPARIYDDVKRLYSLRSLVVHGSNPRQKDLEAQAYRVSGTERTTYKGVKWALALDRARDLLRRAILARGLLLDAERWPGGPKGRRFDVDAQLIEPVAREDWRQSWRGALEAMGLGFSADEATPAALDVTAPDRSQRGRGSGS